MRYSWILENFYQIKFTDSEKDMLDVHFSASAHHWILMKKSMTERHMDFHKALHRAHLRKMKAIVYETGDFAKAVDPSLRGLNEREGWNPEFTVALPDPKMFDSMKLEESCGFGQRHPSDSYLPLEKAVVPKAVKFFC